jgi:tRNA threonylcarbamoyladenosine biosynthesis protein TsaB
MAAATGFPRAAAIHDAKRNEAYLLLWESGEIVFPPTVLDFTDAVERIRTFGAATLAGTGAQAAHEKLGAAFTLTDIRQPDALWVARLALHRPSCDAPPAPLYLRAPDAKLPA